MIKELLNRKETINKITKNRVCTFTFVCTLALLCIFSLNLINNSYLSSAEPEPQVVHTWDVSETKSGNVVAILKDNGELIIDGEADGAGNPLYKLQDLESYSSISPTNYLQLGYYEDPVTKERTYFKKVQFTGKVEFEIDNFRILGERITSLFDNWTYVEEIDCSGIVYNHHNDDTQKFYFNGMINLKRIVLSESMKNNPPVVEDPDQAKGNIGMPIYFCSYGNAFIGYDAGGNAIKVYSGFDNREADSNYCLNLAPDTDDGIAYLEAVPFNKTLMEYVNNEGDYYVDYGIFSNGKQLYRTRISKALKIFVENKKAGKTEEFLTNDKFEILAANIDYIDESSALSDYLDEKRQYDNPEDLENDINVYLTNLIPNIKGDTGEKYNYLDDFLIEYNNPETLNEFDANDHIKMSQRAKYTDYTENELNYVTECNINVTPFIMSPHGAGSDHEGEILWGSDDEYNYYDLFGSISSGSFPMDSGDDDWFATINITNDLTGIDDNIAEFTLYYYTTDNVFENIKFVPTESFGKCPNAKIDVINDINDENISNYKDITEWNEIPDFFCQNGNMIFPLLLGGTLDLSEHLYLKVPKKVAVYKPFVIGQPVELTKTGKYDLFVRKFVYNMEGEPIDGPKSKNHLEIEVDVLDISGKNDKVVRSIVTNKKFTGDVIKPTVHLVYTNNMGREVTLVEGRDYTLEYGDETHDNKTKGENTGLIIVKGISGKTNGERRIEFSINDDGSGASDDGNDNNDDDNKNKGDDDNKGNKGGDIKPSAPSTITIQSSKPNRLSSYMKGYDDKTFKPNGNMTRAEIATVLARLSDGFRENGDYRDFYNYKDINSYNGDWYNNYIGYCTLNDFLNGYGDTFKPNSSMTRAEFATALVRYLKLNGNGSSNTFKDVNGKWYEDSVNILASYGFISGYEDNTFRGDKPISRAEVCTILNNALKRSLDNYNVTDYYKNMMRNTFTDVNENSWYYKDILEAVYAVK